MKIIDEIRRQRNVVGPSNANHVVLRHSAFQRLLAEKDEFVLSQVNTQRIPPTIYGMSVEVSDDLGREVSVRERARTLLDAGTSET
jgi:hypothetical protein